MWQDDPPLSAPACTSGITIKKFSSAAQQGDVNTFMSWLMLLFLPWDSRDQNWICLKGLATESINKQLLGFFHFFFRFHTIFVMLKCLWSHIFWPYFLFTVRSRKKNKLSSSRQKNSKSKSKKPASSSSQSSKQRAGPSSLADIDELVRHYAYKYTGNPVEAWQMFDRLDGHGSAGAAEFSDRSEQKQAGVGKMWRNPQKTHEIPLQLAFQVSKNTISRVLSNFKSTGAQFEQFKAFCQ